jgi:hypothetical protein
VGYWFADFKSALVTIELLPKAQFIGNKIYEIQNYNY